MKIKRSLSLASNLFLAGLLVSVFSGCSSAFSTDPTQQNSSGSEKSSISSPVTSNSATPNEANEPKAGKVGFTCNEFITPEYLYEFNPNFSLDSSKKFSDEKISELLSQLGGINCSYLNLSSGETIQVAITQLGDNNVEQVTKFIEENSSPSADLEASTGDKIFFSSQHKLGVLQVLTGNYWIVVTSSLFYSASDAYNFISPGLSTL